MLKKLIFLSLVATSKLFSQYYEFQSNVVDQCPSINQFYLEPEYLKATYKVGTIKQKGDLYGIRASYDLYIYNSPYLGFESYYRSGTLKNTELKSKYTDYAFEGKLGFTLGIPHAYFLAPYVGLGYENEKNDYETIPVENISYYYLSTGIASKVFLSSNLSLGWNFKLKFPFSGDHKVKNEEIDINLTVSKKIQYNVEVPISYWASPALCFSAVPFYEYKNYNNNSTNIDWKTKATMHQWGVGLRGTFCF